MLRKLNFKKYLLAVLLLILAHLSHGQIFGTQSYLKAKRLEAVDSLRLRGVWYKSLGGGLDSIRFNSSQFVDTLVEYGNLGTTVIGLIDRGTGIIRGGLVTHDSGYTYSVTACDYIINAGRYHSNSGSIVLDSSFGGQPRFDVIAVDSTGTIVKITGVPASNPTVPQIDAGNQLALATILIPAGGGGAGSGVDPSITKLLIYDEHNTPPEWDPLGEPPGSATYADSTYPQTGSVAIKWNLVNDGRLIFDGSTTQVSGYNNLRFNLRLQAAIDRRDVNIILYNTGNSAVSNRVNVTAGHGLVKTTVGSYQNITVPLSNFSITGNEFDQILIEFTTAGARPATVYIDNIFLQGGIAPPNPTTNYVSSVFIKPGTDSLFYVRNNVNYYVGVVGGGGGGGISPSDTLNKWVQNVVPKNDSTITVIKNGVETDILIKGVPGKDSTAYHSISIPAGDSLLVFNDLLGNSDTVSFSLLQFWKKNGSKIFYNDGNIGIGTNTPQNQLSIFKTSVNTDDESGLLLQNSDSSSGSKLSPAIILQAANNNSGSISQRQFSIQTVTPGTPSLSYIKFNYRLNNGAITSPFSFAENGALTITGIFSQTSGGSNSFSGALTTTNGYTSSYSAATGQNRYNFRAIGSANVLSGTVNNFASETSNPWGLTKLIPFSNLYGINLFNQNGGSTGIGVAEVNESAKFEIADTAKGFLLPRLTLSQRGKIISSLSGSISNSGTGYVATTGSEFALTGGSGTGAKAILVVTAGSVTSVTISVIGNGYQIGDILGIAAAGSGFAYTIATVTGPAEGLQIYQTDNTPGPRFYIGGSWYKTNLIVD